METKVTKNQQMIICWFNRLMPIIPTIFFIFSLTLINILSLEKINSFFHSNLDLETFKNLKTFIIMLSCFGIFFNLLYIISASLSNYQKYQQYKMQFIFLSCFGINIFNLIFNLWIYYIYDKNNKKELKTNKKFKKFLINLGIKKWNTHDIVLMGLFIGLTITFAYIEQFLPKLSNGGSIALKYLPIIIIAFVHSFFAGITVGSISALMSLIFIPNAMIISPWSYILDYFLPMISPAICGLLRFKINKKTNYLDYLNYVIMIVLTFLLIYLWQVLSGYFIWVTIYGPNWGNNGWTYSIIYNAIHIWIFTYPLTQILIPPILRIFIPLYQNKQYYY